MCLILIQRQLAWCMFPSCLWRRTWESWGWKDSQVFLKSKESKSSTFSTSGITPKFWLCSLTSLYHLKKIPGHFHKNIMFRTMRKLSQNLFDLLSLKTKLHAEMLSRRASLVTKVRWRGWWWDHREWWRLWGLGTHTCLCEWPFLIFNTPDGPDKTCVLSGKGSWLQQTMSY